MSALYVVSAAARSWPLIWSLVAAGAVLALVGVLLLNRAGRR
jgi:hypothetical protein